MTASPSTTCAACGATGSGNFCSHCGSSLGTRYCRQCGAELSGRARFCHRCGAAREGSPAVGAAAEPTPAPRRSERTAWIVAGALTAVLIGVMILKISGGAPTPVAPNMANTGAQSAAPFVGGAPSPGGAPDISRMSPRERFDRLFNRVMAAAERGDTATVVQFTPMALGAYSQLDAVDADAQYHAGELMTLVGESAGAAALADSILADQPGHLFGYILRGKVARAQGNTTALRQAHREFLQHYAAEIKSNRREYLEHKPVVEAFDQEAKKER